MFGTSDDDYASCIDYFCIKNISGVANTGGVYTEDNTQRLSNSTYYKNITDEVTNSSAPILSSNFLFEDETNGDFYIATDYGIYQCSTSGYTGSEDLDAH
jgi:hypothetical protein